MNWWDSAACATADPGLFFGPEDERVPERRQREERAKTVCAGCPVSGACGAEADRRSETWGVWGGIGDGDRPGKRCPACTAKKPFGAFAPNASRPDGRQSFCQPCQADLKVLARARQREAIAA